MLIYLIYTYFFIVNSYQLFLSTTDDQIHLEIRKTTSNRFRCTFRGCSNRNGLHNVSRQVRFTVMQQRKIYIPNMARVCNQHLNASWNTVGQGTGQRYKFSKKQIEDLIQLLSNSSPRAVSHIPG